MITSANFFEPRKCLREPIPEIAEAAALLSQAVDAHLAGLARNAEQLIVAADIGAVRNWTTSLMASPSASADSPNYQRVRVVADAPRVLAKADRVPARMPTVSERAQILERDGYHCVFCHTPVIEPEIRKRLTHLYPATARWGSTWDDCHAALLCLWLQFDHVLPHARGGTNNIENVVITCAGCNYGRMSKTLDEVGLLDPRDRPRLVSDWNGLARLLA